MVCFPSIHYLCSGFQTLTRISNIVSGDSGGNVQSGMLPPWLENHEDSGFKVQIRPVVGGGVSSLNESAKSKKLNPKRVGAAWAEKRKLEMEMEKRGEIVQSYRDENWLPNFGRVWQSGSRKESRKEFEKEKSKFLMVENPPEPNVDIQPYISKRMVSSIFIIFNAVLMFQFISIVSTHFLFNCSNFRHLCIFLL